MGINRCLFRFFSVRSRSMGQGDWGLNHRPFRFFSVRSCSMGQGGGGLNRCSCRFFSVRSCPLSQGDGGLNRCSFPSVPCILVPVSSQNILITGYGRTAYARTFLMIGNLHFCLSAPQEDNYGHAVEPKR